MGLRSDVQGLVTVAFNTIGDLKTAVTYNQVTAIGTYDSATDSVPKTIVTHDLEVVLASIKENEEDFTDVLVNGQKVLVPFEALPIVPTENDFFTIGGVTWEIIRRKEAPAESLFIFMIRAP